MTSNDTGVYLREDVFNARMDAFMAEIRLENERLRNELNAKIEGNQARNEQQFTEIRGEIRVLSTRMDNLETRMGDMQNSVSWGFTLMTVFVAIIGIIGGVLVAFAPSIWGYIRRKRQPELSRDDVKSIVAEQVKEAITAYFSGYAETRVR